MGYTYSPLIGYQSFEWITLGWSIEDAYNDANSRRLRVIGLATSQNFESFDAAQLSEVRVFGNISKTELRTLIQRNIQTLVRNISPATWSHTISSTQLAESIWGVVNGANRLQNNKVLYFGRNNGENITVQWWVLNAGSNKTLVVEWANVYINWDIQWTGVLGIIALQKNGRGGNIYIDPTVTDIHAFLYADRSVISYNGSAELDGSTPDTQLANQLYIKWVLFSENTIWWSVSNPLKCPFYTSCSGVREARKYDLNYLRRYQIAEVVDDDGVPTWVTKPVNNGVESFMWNSTRNGDNPSNPLRPDLRQFPVILEYDNRITRTPPPLFSR